MAHSHEWANSKCSCGLPLHRHLVTLQNELSVLRPNPLPYIKHNADLINENVDLRNRIEEATKLLYSITSNYGDRAQDGALELIKILALDFDKANKLLKKWGAK